MLMVAAIALGLGVNRMDREGMERRQRQLGLRDHRDPPYALPISRLLLPHCAIWSVLVMYLRRAKPS
jgi:hypothetical protein